MYALLVCVCLRRRSSSCSLNDRRRVRHWLLTFGTVVVVSVCCACVVIGVCDTFCDLLLYTDDDNVAQLNPDQNAFQRQFVSDVRRIEELARKLRFFNTEVVKASKCCPAADLLHRLGWW
jgi:hypothetical protein